MQSHSNKDLNQIFVNAAVFTVLCESIRVFENRNNQVCEHAWGFNKREKGVAAKTADPLVSWVLSWSPESPFCSSNGHSVAGNLGCASTLTSFAFDSTALHSVQFSSVAQLCPTLHDPMNRSTPGLPVHHQLPDSTQTHVHWVADAIQPSYTCRPLLLLPSIFPSIGVFSACEKLCLRKSVHCEALRKKEEKDSP